MSKKSHRAKTMMHPTTTFRSRTPAQVALDAKYDYQRMNVMGTWFRKDDEGEWVKDEDQNDV